MRRFPYSWNTLRTKLGFRKSKARRSARRHRLSRVEPLEIRALLSGDPITTLDDQVIAAIDAPVITSIAFQSKPTYVLTNVTPRSAEESEEELLEELDYEEQVTPAELFLVTTEYTSEGPKAVVSLNPAMVNRPPSGLQTLKLELQLDGQVLETYEILVDIAEERFRTKFLNDRIEAIREKAPELSLEEQIAWLTLDDAEDPGEDTLIAEGRALAGFIGPLTAQQEAARSKYEESLETEKSPRILSERSTDDLLALAADVRRGAPSPQSEVDLKSERIALYAEVENRIQQAKQSRQAAVSISEKQAQADTEKSLQELGLLMVKDIAADLASNDATVKAAAEGLRDELVAIGDIYHTAFTGLGIDHEVQRTVTSRGDLKAYALVESGHYAFDDYVAIDLAGQPAMVQVTRLNPYPYSSLITVQESPAVEDGYIDEASPSTNGGTGTSFFVKGTSAAVREGLLRFNISEATSLANPTPISDGRLQLTEIGTGSGSVDVYVWNRLLSAGSESPSDWDEADLTWNGLQTSLDTAMGDDEFTYVGTWAAGTAFNLDVTAPVRRALLYGDANGDGKFDKNGIAGDIEAFHLAVVDWAAYVAEYGPRANSSADLLARMDGGLGNGVVNTDDITDFLRRYGVSQADFNLDGDVDGEDWSIYQLNYGLTNVRFGQGDANFDGIVDAQDEVIFDLLESEPSPTAESPQLTVWLRPTDNTTNIQLAAQEHTTLSGPKLQVTETPDLVLNDFTVNGTSLRVNYSVLGKTFSNVKIQLFKEGNATPLYTSSTQSGSLGARSLTIATSYLSSIVEGDVVYAKIIGTPTSGTQSNTNNDRLNFEFSTDSDQVVTSLDDIGMDTLIRSKHTLRELLELDAALGWVENITFDESVSEGVIYLPGEELFVDDDVAIHGPGIKKLTIDGMGTSRVFEVSAGNEVSITHLTGMHGATDGTRDGGAIWSGGKLTLDHVWLTNNYSPDLGGGLYVEPGGSLSVSNSTFDNNIAKHGAGVYVRTDGGESFVFKSSTFSNNTGGTGSGGGLQIRGNSNSVPRAPVLIANSTFSNNSTGGQGGGIYALLHDAPLDIINVTVTQNWAGVDGGGIFTVNQTEATLHNSIVAGNTSAEDPDIEGDFSSASSYNLIGIEELDVPITNGINGNLVGTLSSPLDPGLAPLGSYGGANMTHLVYSSSPAVDAGSDAIANAYSLTTDQMGFTRFYDLVGVNDGSGNLTDIGAYEDPPLIEVLIAGDDLYSSQRTLRQALNQAKMFAEDGNPGSVITFAPDVFDTPQEFSLKDHYGNDGIADEYMIDFDVTIVGPGADLLTISGDDQTRIFTISEGAEVAIGGLSLADGYTADEGGGILNYGSLVLSGMVIRDTWADSVGGAVSSNGGTTAIYDSHFYSNRGRNGGGVSAVGGELHIAGTSISENAAIITGGVVALGGATLNIESSSIFSNSSAVGGGVYVLEATSAVITNSTISGNSASFHGAGGVEFHTSPGTIVNSTITANSGRWVAAGGVRSLNSPATVIHNSIIAGNTAETSLTNADVNGDFDTSSSNNLIGRLPLTSGLAASPATATLSGSTSVPKDPKIALLGNYGGPTPTHALMPDSPAINAGSNLVVTNAAIFSEQRGPYLDRIVGTAVDVGAVESHIIRNLDDSFTIYGLSSDDTIEIDANGFTLSYARGSIVREIDLSSATKIIVESLSGNDVVATDAAFAVPMEIYGGSGADYLIGGAGSDVIYGGDGDDIIFGGDGDDFLYGEGGNDQVDGEGGEDSLWGGVGADVLLGGDGDDTLYGEAGTDVLDGGAGADTYTRGSAYDSVTSGVEDYHRPPELEQPPNVSARVGETNSFRILADDVETPRASLEFEVEFAGTAVFIPGIDYSIVRLDDLNTTPVFEWHPTNANPPASYTVTLTVEDSHSMTKTATFTATIEAYNQEPPVLLANTGSWGPNISNSGWPRSAFVTVINAANLSQDVLPFSGTDTQTVTGSLIFGGDLNTNGQLIFDANNHQRNTPEWVLRISDGPTGNSMTRYREHSLGVAIITDDTSLGGILFDPGDAEDGATFTLVNTPVQINLSGIAHHSKSVSDQGFSVSQPSHGTVSSVQSGSVTYTPATDFEGLDQFTWSFSTEDPATTSNTVTFFVEVGRAVKVDLSVEGLSEEEENTGYGALVRLNDDYDYIDNNPWVDTVDYEVLSGPVPEEDDLIKVAVEVDVLRQDAYQTDFLAHFEVMALDALPYEGTNRIRLWTDAKKTKEIIPERIGAVPGTKGESFLISELEALGAVYVEGLTRGRAQLSVVVEGPSTSLFTGERMPLGYTPQGIVTDSDALILTVGLGLTAYRPMQTAPELQFGRIAVPEHWEESAEHGPGIRINGDYDFLDPLYYDPIAEGPATRDMYRDGVLIPNENDLIEVQVDTIPGLTGLVLETNSDAIRLFPSAQKGNLIPFDPDTRRTDPINFSSGTTTVFVEWADFDHGTAELHLVDPTTGERFDTLLFRTFRGMQLQLSGETAFAITTGWGVQNEHASRISEELYQLGYDTHYWEEDEVAVGGTAAGRVPIGGRAVEQLRNHVQNHLVNVVDIVGYSHGGGKAWWIGKATNHNWIETRVSRTYTLGVVGYIDAVQTNAATPTLSPAPQFEKPQKASKLVNAFQTNGSLHGASVQNANAEQDFSYIAGMDHWEIIDEPLVVGVRDELRDEQGFMLTNLLAQGITR